MKKKFVSIVLTALMVASLTTACGGSSDAPATTSTPAADTKAATPAAETNTVEPAEAESQAEPAEPESQAEPAETSASEGFTLLDVTTDMIQTGVYAADDNGTEWVFALFTDPAGTPMASLFGLTSDGNGDVICGTYAIESETDENGITWSALTVSDVYSGNDYVFGFGEAGEEVYLLADSETYYEGKYLSADETIVYMGTAAALLQ